MNEWESNRSPETRFEGVTYLGLDGERNLLATLEASANIVESVIEKVKEISILVGKLPFFSPLAEGPQASCARSRGPEPVSRRGDGAPNEVNPVHTGGRVLLHAGPQALHPGNLSFP